LPKTWLYWFFSVPSFIFACMLFLSGFLSKKRR
jgi:hypothetical protein